MAVPSSTQLWAVSSDGSVFVLQDAAAWVGSVRSNEALLAERATVPLQTATEQDNWAREVGGRFDNITCGFTGTVCAKKDKILYVRKGVSYDSPLGSSWAKALCDAQDIAVGSRCIVRRTSQDNFFVTNSESIDLSSSIFLPHWDSVPRCSDVDTQQLFTLDRNDNLYLVSSSSGEVFVCPNLSSGPSEDFEWEKIAGGPPGTKKRSSIFDILPWGASSNGCLFSAISAGDDCLWCLADGGREVFQLALKFVRNLRRGVEDSVKIEGFWKTFELPEKDEVTLFAADKTEFDILYAVAQENKSILSYAVLQEESGRLAIPNPEGHNSRWRSLSICSIPKPREVPLTNELTQPHSPKKEYPSIYPKLVPHEGFDICCEDGDCSFCRNSDANNSSLLSNESLFLSHLAEEGGRVREGEGEGGRVREGEGEGGRRVREGEGGSSMVTGRSVKRLRKGDRTTRAKRGNVSSTYEEEGETSSSRGKRRKRRREEVGGYGDEASSIAYSPKRTRWDNPHELLVADIPVRIVNRFQEMPHPHGYQVFGNHDNNNYDHISC